MADSQNKQQQTLNSKIEKIRSHVEKLNEKVENIKEERVVQEQEFVHSLVDKIKEKELKNQAFEKQRELAYKEKMEQIKSKNERFKDLTRTLKFSETKRISNLLDRQNKAQERISQKKVSVE